MDDRGIPSMNNEVQQRLRLIVEAECMLYTALDDKERSLSTLSALMQDIEGKLWDAHVRVNGRYRKEIAYFRDLKGKKKPVEQRKTAKTYLDFIKSSQRFYRACVQDLGSRFSGIPELKAIAHKFTWDVTAVAIEEKPDPTPDLRHASLQSCHRMLVHLGDLSRYRETELGGKGKDRNWGPAIGSYDLAIAIYPSAGIPHNQLAIIFRSEGDHARALYYLYRAQCAFEPPPTAFANLELELRKVREASERHHLNIDLDERGDDQSACLERSWSLLHARCFDGNALAEYHDLERRVLGQVGIRLEEQSLEAGFINRMVLSNIAADFTAGDRWQGAPELSQIELAFKSFQRLNIRTFSTILLLLKSAYESRAKEYGSKEVNVVTSTARRLLPSLRYCSSWLMSRAALLAAYLSDLTMGAIIKEFWKAYVETLTIILSNTNFEDLPRPDYLLEEDEEIIGFKPLQEEQSPQKRLNPEAITRKPKCHEHGIKRHHPDIEMLCRIRDLVEDAIELAQSQFVPINFIQDTGRFCLRKSWDGLGTLQAPLHEEKFSESKPAQEISCLPEDSSLPNAESTTEDAVSQGTSLPVVLSTTMNPMVDNLVGPEPGSSVSPPPSTPPAPTVASAQGDGPHETSYGVGNSTLTALDFVNQVRSWSPKAKKSRRNPPASQPSILKFPFAPRPEENHGLTEPSTSLMEQQSHENALSPSQQQQATIHCVESTGSSMSDPTQQSFMLHPLLRNKESGKRLHHATYPDEFNFESSNIITGSSFPYLPEHGDQTTPPNGQG
ncbi:MAG: hypothetical protein L6R35_001234 [Caloplaca aegaea]|nr:MAG: hypothetical protein L6R35_001234 [Caloplaca aegaea]